MFYLISLFVFLLPQWTYSFKNINTEQYFQNTGDLNLNNIVKELYGTHKYKNSIGRINPLDKDDINILKIVKNYGEKPIRRRYTQITFKDLNGIKVGLQPNGIAYIVDTRDIKPKKSRKPYKNECYWRSKRARKVYNYNIDNRRNEDTQDDNTETTPNEEDEKQKSGENDDVKVSLPNTSMELNEEDSNININYEDVDYHDSLQNVVPNDIFIDNEKECANWLGDCNSMGVKENLFKLLWSRYNS